jgi:hypothetical protein
MINFNVSKQDGFWIHSVAMKAARKFDHLEIDLLTFEMDLTACHANGNPLRLRELLKADDFNFAHDVLGIHQHIDHETGELRDCFLPRYSA